MNACALSGKLKLLLETMCRIVLEIWQLKGNQFFVKTYSIFLNHTEFLLWKSYSGWEDVVAHSFEPSTERQRTSRSLS